MQIVILAGGLATRLRPLSLGMPKSMIQVLGKPFLAYQLDILRAAGINDVVLCVGHLGEQIAAHFKDGRDFGVQISYSWEKGDLLGTGGALKNAANLLQPQFFIMYGDSYLRFDYQKMYAAFKTCEYPTMMAVYKNQNKFERSNSVVKDGLVVVFDKKWLHAGMDFIDYGISMLSREVLNLIPDGQVFDLSDLFRQLASGRNLLAYEVEERFYEIGSFQGLKDFTELIQRGEKNDHHQNSF